MIPHTRSGGSGINISRRLARESVFARQGSSLPFYRDSPCLSMGRPLFASSCK